MTVNVTSGSKPHVSSSQAIAAVVGHTDASYTAHFPSPEPNGSQKLTSAVPLEVDVHAYQLSLLMPSAEAERHNGSACPSKPVVRS